MALLSSVRAAAGAAALAALAGGCDFLYPSTPAPGDPQQLVVHAVLMAGSDTAAVIVTRVGDGRTGSIPVPGAHVRVIGAGGTAVLAEQRTYSNPCTRRPEVPDISPVAETGCYAAGVPGGIRAGAEYRLEVDVSTGERVRGSTRVPAAPVVHAPQERLRVPYAPSEWNQVRASSPVTVRWTAQGAANVVGRAERVWARDVDEELAACTGYARWYSPATGGPGTDSLSVTLEATGCMAGPEPVWPDSLEMKVAVTVYDSAYYSYVRDTDNGVPLRQARGTLEGAFGFFGSAASSARHVLLYAQP